MRTCRGEIDVAFSMNFNWPMVCAIEINESVNMIKEFEASAKSETIRATKPQ